MLAALANLEFEEYRARKMFVSGKPKLPTRSKHAEQNNMLLLRVSKNDRALY